MKKLLFGVLGFLCLCAGFSLWKTLRDKSSEMKVSLVSVEIKTVNETVSCNGSLRPSALESLKIGHPAEVVGISVSEGDRVSAGDEILSYRILENDELSLYFRDMLTADAETLVEEGSLAAESGDILAAAEYFSVNGSLPSWFENYYIPVTSDNDTAGEYLILRAGIDGEITKLNVNVGDRVTGVLSSVKIEDKSSFCADIEIPESCIGSVETGQYVAVSGLAFGGKSFPATLISIDNKAKTVDSLLGSGKTVVDGVLNIEAEDDLLISGLTVKCDIFINVWEDAVVVPYSAVCSEGSEEFVWLWNEGKIERRIIHPVYRYSKGAVTVGEFSGDELLVSNCDTILYDGMEIEGELSR